MFTQSDSGIPLGHRGLIQRMQRLIPDVSKKGVCFGIACMKMQAILHEDSITFDKRLELMNKMPEENFVQEIEFLQTKRRAIVEQVKQEIGPFRELSVEEKQELTQLQQIKDQLQKIEQIISELRAENKINQEDAPKELSRRINIYLFNAFVHQKIEAQMQQFPEEERLKLDIPVFLEGVQLYQNSIHPFLSDVAREDGQRTTQNALETYSFTASKRLEEQGGIALLDRFYSIYNKEELTDIFTSFKDIAKKSNGDISFSPIVFILSSSNHGVVVGFDPRNCEWSFTDANTLPTKYISDLQILAQYVINAFSSNENALISFDVYSRAADKQVYFPIVSTWKSQQKWSVIHAIASAKNERVDSSGETLLTYVVAEQDIATLQELLAHETDPDQKQKSKITALNMAVRAGNLEIVRILHTAGADPNYVDTGHGLSPLFGAVDLNRSTIVDFFIEHGADVHQQLLNYCTLLHRIALKGDKFDIKVTRKLIDKKIDINAVMPDGTTALWLAVLTNNKELIQLLLEYNVDSTIPRYFGVGHLKGLANHYHTTDYTTVLLQEKSSIETLSVEGKLLLYQQGMFQPWCPITALELAKIMGREELATLINEHRLKNKAQSSSPRFFNKEVKVGDDQNKGDESHQSPKLT